MKKQQHKGPSCGHSACSQNFIDTGSRRCIAGEVAAMRFPIGSYVEHDARPANVTAVRDGGAVVVEYQTGGQAVVEADELHVPK